MALDLGTLAATLKVNDSQLVSGLQQAESKAKASGSRAADGFSQNISGRLRGSHSRFTSDGRDVGAAIENGAKPRALQAGREIGSAVERGVKPGLAKIGRLFATLGIGYMGAQMVGFGLKTAMGMEKAEISFTTMLGSASKAQAFIGKMKEFAATTPFEFPELQTAAGKLMAAGIATNKVIPIMTTLGNVTSGMGTGSEGVNRATVALQQMNAAGKITAEDLNQLRDAGVPVYDLLAAATGKTTAQIAKMASTGKLGKKELDAMMKALETGKGLEKFGGLMEAQSKSLEGTISTMKDNLGQGLAGALEPIMPFLKDGIGALSKALPGAGKWLKGLIENFIALGEALAPITEPMISFIEDGLEKLGSASLDWSGLLAFVDTLKTMGQWVLDNKLWIGQLVTTLAVLAVGFTVLAAAQAVASAGGFVSFIMGVVKSTGLWTAAQWLLNVALNANPISLIVIAIAALVAGLIYAYNTSEEFRNVVNAAFAAVGEAGRWLWNNALAPVVRFIVNGFAMIVDGIAGMLDALGNIPGFGWAKDAATKMRETAAQARAIASGIKEIPKNTTANVTLNTKLLGATWANLNKFLTLKGGRAAGGPVEAGGLYLVGENGPELVRFENAGMVYNNKDTRRMLGGGEEADAYRPVNLRSSGTPAAPTGAAAPSITVEDIAEGMRRALLGTALSLSGGDRFLNQLSAVIVDDMARGVA